MQLLRIGSHLDLICPRFGAGIFRIYDRIIDMPVRRHALHTRSHKHPSFLIVYLLSIIFSFHSLLVAYSNSTYLDQFIPPEGIGALYTISSAIAVLGFLFISRVLRNVGNTKLLLILAVIKIFALVVLGFTTSPAIAVVMSFIFLTVDPLMFLNLDIYSESLIGKDESSTGSKRGLILSLMSLASVCSPLALAFIVGGDNSRLNLTYFYSAGVFLVFVAIVIYKFWTFDDPKYKEIQVLKSIRSFWGNSDLRNVFLAQLCLQVFFSWMVIYFPLYLATEIGLDWGEIGSIIAFGLFAYVLFEYPIGYIADKFIGEREMMAAGFLILAVSSGTVSLITTATVGGWMALMYISRIGASLVEATAESYFFKHTKGTDANIMSFFRLSRPLAGVAGALLGSATLLFLPFQLIFIILGLIMLPGVYFSMQLEDTK